MIDRRAVLAAGGLGLLATPARADESVQIPFRITRNRPWVAVSLNNRDPLAFLVDTGANFFSISHKAAKANGLPRIGQGKVQAAVGRADIAVYLANTLTLGGGAVREREALLGATTADDEDLISGVVPMARWAVMGLDFDSQQLTVATRLPIGDPEGYEVLETTQQRNRLADGSVNRLPGKDYNTEFIDGVDQRPVINATLDGKPVRLLVDTGFTGMLFLFPDYVKANGLWDWPGKRVESHVITAVGGARTRRVRGQKLKIGRYAFASPIIDLASPLDSDKDGVQPIDGIVGLDVIRRLSFLHHPRRTRLYIKPSKAIQDVCRYDRAGMDADLVDGAIRITWLDPAGPAARAGLKMSDRITGWRGTDGFYGMLWALRGAPGSKVEIQVMRDGAPTLVTVVLEEVI